MKLLDEYNKMNVELAQQEAIERGNIDRLFPPPPVVEIVLAEQDLPRPRFPENPALNLTLN